MSTVHLLQQFDPAQLFRLFVDGRFHRKYKGWVGYEAGEQGSVQALLDGFTYMMDHFDLTGGLHSTYLMELHKVCMFGVRTKNPKSSPGDLRFLNSGMPFFPKTTTLENIREILDMRRGDGTPVFNNKAWSLPAEELDAEAVMQAIHTLGKLNYRNWYPILDAEEQAALEKKRGIVQFYEIKQRIQMQFAHRVQDIVDRFNASMAQAANPDAQLRAIALVVRELELLHPFPDGNCRTFACVLLTQLLLNYDFTPTLLENPNLDGEYSLDQWIGEIHKGMALFEMLLHDPKASVYGYSIDDSSAEDQRKFADMSREFVARIQAYGEGMSNETAATRDELFLTPERLIKYTGGHWQTSCPDTLRFRSVGTYNTFRSGNLYFALEIAQWEKEGKDVRQELQKVIDKGARALVVDHPAYAADWPVPVCVVKDGYEAFKAVAIGVRKGLAPLTILITGTEGKTGAKVQLHHLLNFQTRAHGVRNSANTEVPVLRSLAGLHVDDRVEISEVSVGGDEALRVDRALMVSPDLCLFTNIGPNHMDMHKTMESLLHAKSSVVVGLREDGLCIINTANPYADGLREAILARKPNARIIGYGTQAGDAAQLLSQTFDVERLGWQIEARIDDETLSYFLPLVQQHAPLASVGVLLTVKRSGFDVRRAAADYASIQPFETMGALVRLPKQDGEILFYDQSRRGGISGMRSAFGDLPNFKPGKGRVIALVGGISVLRDSDWTKEAHHQLAELINHSPIDRLYTTGNYIEYVHERLDHPPVLTSNDLDELTASLVADVQPGDLLFIIGSAYLYLGRVADRIRQILVHGVAPPAVVIGDHPRAADYRLLKVYEAVQRGTGTSIASASHGTPYPYYQSAVAKYPNYAAYRGHLLEQFLAAISHLLVDTAGMRDVSKAIAETAWTRYVATPDFCRRWYNNVDKNPKISSKQVFGLFFDFGDPVHLLYVNLATFNLHVGLVRCRRQGETWQPEAMTEARAHEALAQYPALKSLQAEYRTWGPHWLSGDLGRFIEPIDPAVFLAMVDPASSQVFQQGILPFAKAVGTAMTTAVVEG
ncbi:MAG: hypothetical protein LBE50_06480 [Gallionellaceae bacterium]|jgi:UDP-N-acetylmuramyl pentapeptide synthase|nr:hypothetical protein [Gallionellaceae bacterium]